MKAVLYPFGSDEPIVGLVRDFPAHAPTVGGS
jgi:hypothetical protein